ncbi:MAG: PQQ-dependent sugar dehydrogenase [Alcanivoracaceae bacterium]|nr:PQQ-dependent sugar dehydrogenase [Alcanivoracaceae bacterium]
MRITILLICLISIQAKAIIPANLELIEVAQASSPVAFISANDQTHRMFIVEQQGLIKILNKDETELSVFLDISSKIELTHTDQGLLGLVFDPDYINNGYFYVNYVRPGGDTNMGVTVIERYHVSEDLNLADIDSSDTILEVSQFYHNHNGGTMIFGDQGYLYIAMGDGGHRRDPENHAQNLNQLLGKMLRINVNPDILFKNGNELVRKCGIISNYYIPEDNPYFSDNNACDEIYFSGLRSPWKWSIDRLTGDIFIGDVGQDNVEEINFIASSSNGGENLGWSCKEGHLILLNERCPTDLSTLTEPIISYLHNSDNSGNSIVGGYVYRSRKIPELYGNYIYADTISGAIWFATFNGTNWETTLWNQQHRFIVSFAEDQNGNLFTVNFDGAIRKFVVNND